jgi:1-acyl-sn-glycerol-3-phosphate acyltransferase
MHKEFNILSEEVVKLNQKALDLGHNILVFPQGTRSKRLLPGHTGMAQMTQRLNLDIIPIACMGSEEVYQGNIPWGKSGIIRYRIGTPLQIGGDKLAKYRVQEPFTPFGTEAQQQYGDRFRRITDVVMDEINALLDEEYQYDPESTQTVDISKRFV